MKKTLVSALTTALVVGAASTTFAAANPFSDVPADHWAYDSVSKLAAEGVINGYTDGSFEGNSTMSRYEMAQIVAKAMANQEKVNADQKAMIDKLAAEFSDELASLGVRVAALESKVDNVKWGGIVRYTASTNRHEADKDESVNKIEIRLMPQITINDNWTANARIRAEVDTKTNSGSKTNTYIDRLWAQGNYDNFTVKIGKLPHVLNSTHGLIYDNGLSGIEATFGKDVKLQLAAGRTDTTSNIKKDVAGKVISGNAADYYSAEVTYANGKFDGGVAYANFGGIKNNGNIENNADKMGVFGVGAKYKFDTKWAVQADYAKASNMELSDNKDSYNYQLTYGTFKKATPGTFEVYAAYRKQNTNVMNAATTYDTVDGAIKGWVFGAQVGLAKNIYTKAEYFMGKDYTKDTNDKKNLFYGKVEFIF